MRNPQEYYNAHSHGYAQKWDLSPEGLKRPANYYRLKAIEVLIKLASIKPQDKVIEIGCGTGLVLKEVLKTIKPIYGTDISLEMLQRAKDTVLKDKKVSIVNDLSESNSGSDVFLMQDDLLKSKLPHKFFDKVLSMEVLRYNDDLAGCLNNVRAMMKDGGTFVFTVTNFFSLGLFPAKYSLRKLLKKVDQSRELAQFFVTERSIKKELAKAGFSIIAFEKTGLLLSNQFVGRLVEKLSKTPMLNQLSDTFIIAAVANPTS